jgi:hypothetical protein
MTRLNDMVTRVPRRGRIGLGAAVLLALGAAGGAGAVSLTRPAIEMAPTNPIAIASLSTAGDVVTVKGRVAEVYGNSFVLQDSSGKAMIEASPESGATIAQGTALTVQGHYADGHLRASYLIDAAGRVKAVAPIGPGPHHGPGHGRDDRPAHAGPGGGGPDGPGCEPSDRPLQPPASEPPANVTGPAPAH